jgi:hypothetical protein
MMPVRGPAGEVPQPRDVVREVSPGPLPSDEEAPAERSRASAAAVDGPPPTADEEIPTSEPHGAAPGAAEHLPERRR